MASCGPPTPPAAATPAAAATATTATTAARAAATSGTTTIHRVTRLQHSLSSNDNANTSSDILPATSEATAAAVLISGSTSTQMKLRCNFCSEDVACLGLLHEVAAPVPSVGRTRARTSCCLRRLVGKECRLYTRNVTKYLIRRLRKASYYIIQTG